MRDIAAGALSRPYKDDDVRAVLKRKRNNFVAAADTSERLGVALPRNQ